MKKNLLIMVIGFMSANIVLAQEEPKLSVKPSGRILFDAAYINPQKDYEEKSIDHGNRAYVS